MFTEQRLVFIHCVSPVHMGSGTTLGIVDNPIQRERHTSHPLLAGSGIKGAVRHHFTGAGRDNDTINAVFGPEAIKAEGDSFAGAISFTDAQLLLFPVRSARQAFIYITCPLALARARRLGVAGLPEVNVPDHTAWIASDRIGSGGAEPKLDLELFQFKALQHNACKEVATQLSAAFPDDPAWAFFREKVKTDLAILTDTDFDYFARNATLVEPHVAINNETGAADGGKLFYTENLPPESVLVALLLASKTRRREGQALPAAEVAEFVTSNMPPLLQIGGDATTGRGQVALTFAQVGGQQ